MELRDSRRLTGANFLWERPGAVLDLLFDASELEAADGRPSVLEAVARTWRGEARRLLDAVDLADEATTVKVVRTALPPDLGGGMATGLSMALSAPLDALYAACSIAEKALDATVARLGGEPVEGADFDELVVALRAELDEERNPALLALREAAHARGVTFLSDDDEVSVGMGKDSVTWPARELPAPDAVGWSAVRDLPHAIVTGTNGKSTTVRLMTAMAEAAGHVVGSSSTDYVRVGDEILDRGDWSGPGGGRMLLRDRRVTLGLLETARGGMMRRGLALERTDLAVILNVDDDHLSEWATPDLVSLADAKLIPGRIARTLVLNADDEQVIAAHERMAATLPDGGPEVVWFSLDGTSTRIATHRATGGRAAILDDGVLTLVCGDEAMPLCDVAEVPMTLGGAARYNVANALAACAAGGELGLGLEAIRAGLRAFASDPEDNPGRLNRFDLGGATALVDFAHNPGGFAALFEAASALPAERRLVLVGQSGDRDLDSTRGMARSCAEAGFDLVVIKELTGYLRGRELGEVPAEIETALRQAGLDEGRFEHAPSELAAVRRALEWARSGDLLLLLTHDLRDEVLALVGGLAASGWRPGDPVPGDAAEASA